MSQVPRLFIPDDTGAIAKLIKLTGEQAHHCQNVLRLKNGDLVELVLAGGRTFTASLQAEGDGLMAKVTSEIERLEENFQLTLLMAACKGDKNDFIVEKATELNAARIIFYQAEHSIGKLGEPQLERFKRKAEAAASQSKRSDLPEIEIIQGLKNLRPFLSSLSKETVKLLCSLEEGTKPLNSTMLTSPNALIAVGPEGDFSLKEYEVFKESDFISISLGSLVLRAETAALTALAGLRTLYLL